MIRIFLISFLALAVLYLFLQGRTLERSSEKPVFLRTDEIASAHSTHIKIIIESKFKPDSVQLEKLKRDYSFIWAHLNHLYASGDIISGKEYYTENWFRQLARNYDGVAEPVISRKDEYHKLYIKNWASDGLVCTAVDSNVVFKYTNAGRKKEISTANLAVVLLFQGDNWRIDALKFLNKSGK